MSTEHRDPWTLAAAGGLLHIWKVTAAFPAAWLVVLMTDMQSLMVNPNDWHDHVSVLM